ncbi:hypothetical protein CBS147346_8500 [Aspergillus niger]|nr:hypothetical protein CBS147346_8500 [Aspergillus niger]
MSLNYKVFSSTRPGVNRSTPAGRDHLKWVPTTSTLIFGQRDAVLVDTQLTKAAAKDLVDWVVGTGKNLTTIYISHAHGDHFYGTGALLEKFPEAKVLATRETVSRMVEAINPEGMDGFWRKLFPGEIPEKLVMATPLEKDHIMLENERLEAVRLGHTDTDDTTALSLGAYNWLGSRGRRGLQQHAPVPWRIKVPGGQIAMGGSARQDLDPWTKNCGWWS